MNRKVLLILIVSWYNKYNQTTIYFVRIKFMSILNENIDRIRVMGLVNEQDESKDQMNVNLRKKVVEILNFLKSITIKMEKC
jgi:hypothetical protein